MSFSQRLCSDARGWEDPKHCTALLLLLYTRFLTKWLPHSCRSSSNNLIRYFSLWPWLALGCQQVCHDFAQDLLLVRSGQKAAGFTILLKEGSRNSDKLVRDRRLTLHSYVIRSSLEWIDGFVTIFSVSDVQIQLGDRFKTFENKVWCNRFIAFRHLIDRFFRTHSPRQFPI